MICVLNEIGGVDFQSIAVQGRAASITSIIAHNGYESIAMLKDVGIDFSELS